MFINIGHDSDDENDMGEDTFYSVGKVFTFRLSNGVHVIPAEDAPKVRDALNYEIPREPSEYERQEVTHYTRSYNNQVDTRRKDVPLGFIEIDRNIARQIAGRPLNTYIYFKNPAGQYGFLIENHRKYRFKNLGSIPNPSSLIGRILRQIPSGHLINKRYIRDKGIYADNQVGKAVIDILALEGFLERKAPADSRRLEVYVRTRKASELEVENDHEPHKVLVSSSPQTTSQ